MAAQPRVRLREHFVADLLVEQAAFMARSHVFNAPNNFQSSYHYALHVVAKKIERSTLTSNDGMPH